MQVSPQIFKALKLTVWVDNLNELIKRKSKSISKLSIEANWHKMIFDNEASEKWNRKRKYSFEKLPNFMVRFDLLKSFLLTENLWSPTSGMQDNILRKLEHWKISSDGTEIVNSPDIMSIFPVNHMNDTNRLEKIFLALDYVEKEHRFYFLTPTGMKLKKIQTLLER